MPAKVTSRLGHVHLAANAAVAVAVESRLIAEDVRRRAPREAEQTHPEGHLADLIHEEPGRVWTDAWWAHFPEFGTIHMSAQPFFTPAAEAARARFVAAMRDRLGTAAR